MLNFGTDLQQYLAQILLHKLASMGKKDLMCTNIKRAESPVQGVRAVARSRELTACAPNHRQELCWYCIFIAGAHKKGRRFHRQQG
ncbi:hypothetical protein N9L19_00205 [bacterium]|nr:hypothetical protein [bacterium]